MVQGDPTATAALLELPEAQFFAQSELARQIADRCTTVGFNQLFSTSVAAHRFGANAETMRAANRNAGVLELDVGTRSLQARYDVAFNEANLCPIAEGELARKSALSAILIPI
jgi:hypothetical protein